MSCVKVYATLVLPIAEILHSEFKDAIFERNLKNLLRLIESHLIYSYSDENSFQRSRFNNDFDD